MTSLNRRQLLTAGAAGAVTVGVATTTTGSAMADERPHGPPAGRVTTGAERAAASGWSVLRGQ
ncbi:MAG: DUF1343 domain-containing protein, partial [Terracoccus sp.]